VLCQPLSINLQPVTQETVLAVGYNREGDTQLQFANQEATQVAHLMGGETWFETTTTKTKFLTEARHYRYLHLACHAEFDLEHPLQSNLHLGPQTYLTMGDIFGQLSLQAEVVTLSACESGLHQILDGDELFGLVRALLYAGAGNVVASLWRVDDESTLWLMTRFYTYLKEGDTPATALKKAQLDLKEGIGLAAGGVEATRDFSDPYYWAAFVLVGQIRATSG
jgi:CHAT domain-containing protein